MKKFLYVVAFVFVVVAILHFVRFMSGTSMTVGTWGVPMYVSVAGFIAPGILSVLGIHYAKRCR